MFAQAHVRPRQILADQQVPKDRGYMGGLPACIHSADSATQEEFQASWKRIDIGRREDCDAIRLEQSADVPQETDRTFDVLDHLDGGDQVEGPRPELRGKIGLIEIDHSMGQVGHKIRRVAISGGDLALECLKARSHGTGARAQVQGPNTGAGVVT